jgi:hypothetical protein
MEDFQTVFKNGRYQTLNKKGIPIDTLWHKRQCLNCGTKLYTEERTFCVVCKRSRKS